MQREVQEDVRKVDERRGAQIEQHSILAVEAAVRIASGDFAVRYHAIVGGQELIGQDAAAHVQKRVVDQLAALRHRAVDDPAV